MKKNMGINPTQLLLCITVFLYIFLAADEVYAEIYGKLVPSEKKSQEENSLEIAEYFDGSRKIATEKLYADKGYVTVEGEIPDGTYKVYDGDEIDNSRVVQTAEFKNNKRNGLTRKYDTFNYHYPPVGLKIQAEARLKDGIASGQCREFYESGAVKKEYNMQQGSMDGPFRSYYMSGALLAECNFSKGFIDGKFKSFYESGAVFTDEVVKNGIPKSEKEFYENGKIMQKYYKFLGIDMLTFYSMTGRGFGMPGKKPYREFASIGNSDTAPMQGAAGNNEYFVSIVAAKTGDKAKLEVRNLKDYSLESSLETVFARFAVAPKGNLVAMKFGDFMDMDKGSKIIFYDVESLAKRDEYVFDKGYIFGNIYFDPSGKYLAGGLEDNDGNLEYFILETGAIFNLRKTGISGYRSVSFSGDGKTMAVAISLEYPTSYGGTVMRDGIEILDTDTLKAIKTITMGKDRKISGFALSPDGNRILIVAPREESNNDDSNNLIIIGVKDDSKLILVGDPKGPSGVAWYPDGKHVISGGFMIYIWDAQTGSLEGVLPADGGGDEAFSFTNDGNYIIAGQSNTVKIWKNPVK